MQGKAEDLEAMATAEKVCPSWVWIPGDTAIGREGGHFCSLSCGGLQSAVTAAKLADTVCWCWFPIADTQAQ